MKNLLLSACCLAAFALNAETYNLIGQRHLRLYTAPYPSQSYNAEVDAQTIANTLCNVPWTPSKAKEAESTSHVNDQLDANVVNRDKFDAALFCADHTNGTHRAYANAAVYRYRLPDGALPHLTRLSAQVSSDPYNSLGARVVLYTNSTGEIPMDCATCRGEVSGGIKLTNVAPRITRTIDKKDYWYPNTTNAVFTQSVQLQKYLFVFVLMENYASARGNWLEGCSYMRNLVSITTDAAVPGWIDGQTVDLTSADYIAGEDEWMPYFETTNTIVTAENQTTHQVFDFSAPRFAYRFVHYGSTNISHVTHFVSRFDASTWTRGLPATNVWSAPAGTWVIKGVVRDGRVAVTGHDVYLERGFEVNPPSRGTIRSDADGDGIADGWEIYVGSDPLDPSDAVSDWDGDGLSLAEEYDHGYFPTDPNSKDSDGDGITDNLALMYHLKGGDAGKDFDGDGLSNYAEYLISEVWQYRKSDPDKVHTHDSFNDYFAKLNNSTNACELYAGEILTDHDQMDDTWEAQYTPLLNPTIYDAELDADADGWSNFAEFRAGTDPTDALSRPDPTILASVANVYDLINTGKADAKIVFRAWKDRSFSFTNNTPAKVKAEVLSKDESMNGADYAEYEANVGDFSRGQFAIRKTRGFIREGLNSFACFVADGNGEYVPGAPFGVVRGVDVGWQGAKFTVELTEVNPITPRISLREYKNDRNEYLESYLSKIFNSHELAMAYLSRLDIVRTIECRTRIRVVRFGVDDMMATIPGVYEGGLGRGFTQTVVYDRYVDDHVCDLSEAIFLDSSRFDIDWTVGTNFPSQYTTVTETGGMTGEIVDSDGNKIDGVDQANLMVTNMTYLVVVGEGNQDFRGSGDTNSVRTLASVVTRRFEKVRSRPVVDSTHTTFYCAQPTFKWSMPNEDPWASEFGSTYTAFRLQIVEDAMTSDIVYDSGIVRAPEQDAEGNFVWTAPVCAGSQTPQGKVFEPLKKYKWHVTMYNAKFRSDFWSSATGIKKTYGSFTMNVNRQQEVNDHVYSSIDVAVKYTGPSNVLEKHTDLADLKGKVRVQAFTTADFSGEPVAEACAVSEVANATNALPNVTLLGLAVGGDYFVRAYIDMNGNFKKDDWESWGCAKAAISLRTIDRVAPTVGLFIEDADTDRDWLPDAWEYAFAGWRNDFADKEIKNNLNAKPNTAGEIAVTANLLKALNEDKQSAGLSSGLPGATLGVFQSTDYALALLGISSDSRSTFDAIREKVKAKVEPNTLKVTSLTLAEGKVVLTVDADVAYEIPGTTLSKIYDLSPFASVTVKVYKKDNLLDAAWTLVDEVTKTFSKGEEKVEVPVENVDLTSGFYKVEIVE